MTGQKHRRKTLPQGSIYTDGSSRGVGRSRPARWCAEIVFMGVRLRKRSTDVYFLRRWLFLVNMVMQREFGADYDHASAPELVERFKKLKPMLLSMSSSKLKAGN